MSEKERYLRFLEGIILVLESNLDTSDQKEIIDELMNGIHLLRDKTAVGV